MERIGVKFEGDDATRLVELAHNLQYPHAAPAARLGVRFLLSHRLARSVEVHGSAPSLIFLAEAARIEIEEGHEALSDALGLVCAVVRRAKAQPQLAHALATALAQGARTALETTEPMDQWSRAIDSR